MFDVMCSTYCVCMFLCLLYAPIHQNKFQVGVNLLGNKYYSDSDSDSLTALTGVFLRLHLQTWTNSLTLTSYISFSEGMCVYPPKLSAPLTTINRGSRQSSSSFVKPKRKPSGVGTGSCTTRPETH